MEGERTPILKINSFDAAELSFKPCQLLQQTVMNSQVTCKRILKVAVDPALQIPFVQLLIDRLFMVLVKVTAGHGCRIMKLSRLQLSSYDPRLPRLCILATYRPSHLLERF